MRQTRGRGAALVDGRWFDLADASLPVTDEGVARGDGAFETIGVWDGRPFEVAAHLERLTASLRALALPAPDTALLLEEIERLVAAQAPGDAALRLYVTASGTRVVLLSPQPSRPPPRRLVPQPAPWVRPLGTYGPAGAKTMSYAPNMAATRAARQAGGDDALLVSLEGHVLEGPTFAIFWLRDGTLHTPGTDLGIVPSISRRHVLDIAREQGLDVLTGAWPLDALAGAAEVMACSSVRDVIAVESIGDLTFEGPTPVRDAIAGALTRRRRG